MVGVGIDQIEVSRIRDSLEKHGDHFLKKIFSAVEQDYCKNKADPAPCWLPVLQRRKQLQKRWALVLVQSLDGWIVRYPTEKRESRFFHLVKRVKAYSKVKGEAGH